MSPGCGRILGLEQDTSQRKPQGARYWVRSADQENPRAWSPGLEEYVASTEILQTAITPPYQTGQTDQSAAQQSHSAGFRNRRRCESCVRSAVGTRGRAEVDREASKLTCVQASAGEHEGQRVSTHDPTRLPLDVGVIEAKSAELAYVLSGLQALETQP